MTLLPHTQLVELCLAFEAHSPLHIKSSLWPTNLAAAVAELQLPTQTVQETPTDDPRVASHTEALASGASNHETSAADESPRPQQPTIADDTSQPTLQGVPSTSIQSATIPPSPGPYHHIPYGYPQTQPLAAYPHTPYYTLFSHAHNFPPHPSASYAHTSYPQSQPPAGQTSFSPFTGIPLARHPHTIGVPPTDHNGIPADDLPSYEDMLVEALTDLNEPDGSAPKSLFTWMASRYPLHSNFRPSASQALQKAFKRGRLEKGSNGKYRLNASWDGGSVRSTTQCLVDAVADICLPDIQAHDTPTANHCAVCASGIAGCATRITFHTYSACTRWTQQFALYFTTAHSERNTRQTFTLRRFPSSIHVRWSVFRVRAVRGTSSTEGQNDH